MAVITVDSNTHFGKNERFHNPLAAAELDEPPAWQPHGLSIGPTREAGTAAPKTEWELSSDGRRLTPCRHDKEA